MPLPWSPYDASVPHTTGLPDVQARFATLRQLRGPAVDGALERVRELVVVVSSSRGGSTLIGALLRRVPGLLHLSAEINPLFALAGLADVGQTEVLAEEIALDLGSAGDAVDPLSVAWRLTAQWPEEAIDPDAVVQWAREDPDPVAVLRRAQDAHPTIDLRYYDLPHDGPPAAGPPSPKLVEMPPFVVPPPWRRATAEQLESWPVVLTTPRNSYRLAFLQQLFPNARLRLVHLTRNPAASVNGLIDGWLHHGFFNCEVGRVLSIRGYSDAFPEWGASWWNYDIPPGWMALTDRPLAEVCAAQWLSPHEAALAFMADSGVEVLRVRFEDVVGPAPRRRAALAQVGDWLGVGADAVAALAGSALPPVMATAPPAERRWRARAATLAPVLADERVADLASRLGYETDTSTWT